MKLESNTEKKEIVMRGFIGDYENGISADDFRDALAEHAGQDVTIHLNSEGGSVTDGLSMFNAIANHDGKVTVHIDALAASIATVVAIAAAEVKMSSNGKFMIHRCWTAAVGNCQDFRSMADVMDLLDKDIAASYSEKTGASEEEMLAMMDAETWMDAETALNAGFIDEIVAVKSQKSKKKDEDYKVKSLCSPAFHAALRAKCEIRRLKLKS
jgi:ATP-dependent protease ClpP protease subunit|tara:strand:+ start:350 stop:985 length:636 start_codon:yes stop_codon:yes gene_type:complete